MIASYIWDKVEVDYLLVDSALLRLFADDHSETLYLGCPNHAFTESTLKYRMYSCGECASRVGHSWL
jgi:hypothetical protein